VPDKHSQAGPADADVSFRRLEVEPAYRIVAKAVEQQIMEGRIKVGDRLPPETELARQFGVNRSTIREGIRALEQNGLVSRKQGRRLVATVPHYADLADRVSQALVLHEVTFHELWETMLPLEILAAELAAERAGDDQLAELAANVEKTKASTGDARATVRLDVEFHLLVARAARNKALLLAREPIGLLFYPSFYNVMSRLNASDRLLVAHAEILSALQRHDVEHARRWMDKHIRDFRRGYELASLDIDAPVDAVPPP
jgi:GntR family transcriptional repressor for pyruvate dehydrogenase complex